MTPGTGASPRRWATSSGLKPDDAWDMHVGDPVVLSIRPESWKLREAARTAMAAAAANENVVQGRIGHSVYLGEVAEYDFQPRAIGCECQACRR